jgi:hypothetical protein
VLAREKKMKKRLFVYIGCALLLSGCAHWKGVPTFEERSRPQVAVKDGRIVVSPEILFYFKDERDVLIVWQLPTGAKYKFPKDGIVIEGKLSDRGVPGPGVGLDRQDDIVDCKARNDFEFTCLNRHREPGVYKYTIRVEEVEKSREGKKTSLERDPPLVNM